MNENKATSVLIAGGGIAGLTAAIALAERNIQTTVVEQASDFDDIGAGIQLQPNATRVLFKMGFEQALSKISVEPSKGAIRVAKTGLVLHRPKSPRAATGFPHYQIHRADLQHMLLDRASQLGVTIITAAHVKACQQSTDSVTLHTNNGAVFHGDALIGADGVRSTIRTQLFGNDAPVFTGNVAYRGLVETGKLNCEITPGAILGPGRHFVLYHLRHKSLINFVAQVETEHWQNESWTSKGNVDELKALYNDWDPQVTELLSHVEKTFVWALYTRAPMSSWSNRRIGLIGDACHPTLPNLASGAAMAIEDGYIIAELLQRFSNNIPKAFATFYAMRFERCKKIQQGSKHMANFFHIRNPIEQQLKYTPIALISKIAPNLIAKKITWTNQYDATSAVDDFLA